MEDRIEGPDPLTGSTASPGKIHAKEDNHTADDLLDPKALSKENDARGNPRDGDQVLVDQDPIGPDAGDACLPSRERESSGEDRGEGHGRHAPAPTLSHSKPVR